MLTNQTERLRRIERLERRNRVVITATVAILLLACLAAARSKETDVDVVRAHRFELLDSKGNQQGVLGVLGTTPVLRLGEAAYPRASIEVQDAQTAMTLSNPGTCKSAVVFVATDPRSIVQADVLRGQVEGKEQK